VIRLKNHWNPASSNSSGSPVGGVAALKAHAQSNGSINQGDWQVVGGPNKALATSMSWHRAWGSQENSNAAASINVLGFDKTA
jgi:hypothetical protein